MTLTVNNTGDGNKKKNMSTKNGLVRHQTHTVMLFYIPDADANSTV
jgi:hypothetical protein